jgi:hypothetical protein
VENAQPHEKKGENDFVECGELQIMRNPSPISYSTIYNFGSEKSQSEIPPTQFPVSPCSAERVPWRSAVLRFHRLRTLHIRTVPNWNATHPTCLTLPLPSANALASPPTPAPCCRAHIQSEIDRQASPLNRTDKRWLAKAKRRSSPPTAEQTPQRRPAPNTSETQCTRRPVSTTQTNPSVPQKTPPARPGSWRSMPGSAPKFQPAPSRQSAPGAR